MDFSKKILDKSSCLLQVAAWKNQGKKVVFTNGCFDILHFGHIDYLSKASVLGDKLVVGLNSDSSVKSLNKGASRPLQTEHSRSHIVAALQFVDAVCVFDEETPLDLINTLMPNVLVKGGDYSIAQIVGAKEVESNGGTVVIIPLVEGYSTTSIETKIKEAG